MHKAIHLQKHSNSDFVKTLTSTTVARNLTTNSNRISNPIEYQSETQSQASKKKRLVVYHMEIGGCSFRCNLSSA